VRQGFIWHGDSEAQALLVLQEMRTRLSHSQAIAPGFNVLITIPGQHSHNSTEVTAVVRRVDRGPPIRLRLEWEGGCGWRAQRDIKRVPGLQELGTPQELGCEIINVVGHGRLVCATSLFRQLRAICGVDLTAEEEGVLIALAGVKSSDSSVETALDFDRVSSLLRGETESQSMPEPEPEPDYPETLQFVGQNSADERARRNAADIELAAVLAATAATDRELAQVQLQIECAHKPGKQMQPVEVQTWSEWDAAVLAATDSANPPPALFVKSAQTGGEETVGQVLKVDGHRVRVEWTASGKKQWTTKRDLRVGR
jgi:hypothetical protein